MELHQIIAKAKNHELFNQSELVIVDETGNTYFNPCQTAIDLLGDKAIVIKGELPSKKTKLKDDGISNS